MSQPSRNNSPRAGAAQTASIGDQDMMTFLFNDNLPSGNISTSAEIPVTASVHRPNTGTQDMCALLSTTPAGIPDPLMPFLSRGDSLNDEDAFDTASLDALLNSVRNSPQEHEREVSDLTATDTLSSMGELSRAHARAKEKLQKGGTLHMYHQKSDFLNMDNNGLFMQQPQGAPTYGGQDMELQGSNMFQPSQPVSVSTGAAFAIPPLSGIDYGSINDGGGLLMGFSNEGMAPQQQQQPPPQAQLPCAMMPQQQAYPAPLSNSYMPHPVAQMPQNTGVTFEAASFTSQQQPQHMRTGNPWDSVTPNRASGQLKSPNPKQQTKNARSNKRKNTKTSTGTTSSFYPSISEDESDRKKRRSQRNLREQERSHQITARISELRTLLAEAGVHFKPDRYSTLVGVVSYIKTLQGRTKALDEEHRKLIDTISGANRLANGGTTTVQSHNKVLGENSSQFSSSDSNTDEEFLIFLQGIDYKFIFKSCGVALAITSVDGRFVDCNEEFLKVTEYSRDELLGGEKDGMTNSSNTSGKTDTTSPTIGGLVTVYTNTSANASEMTSAAALASSPTTNSPTPDLLSISSSRPPTEVRMHKKSHLSLFNLLGRDDMESVYAAMSRMLRAPNSDSKYVSSSSRDASNSSSGRTSTKESSAKESSSTVSSSGRGESSSMPRSSSSDSMLGSTTSSSGNEVSGDGISRYTVDHWSGKVKHMRQKEQFVSEHC